MRPTGLKYYLDKNPKWTDLALANGTKATALNKSLPSAYVTLGRIPRHWEEWSGH